ncbi:hypothetical protein RDWZM_009219 [Blomia tropicalis]|uniref:RRM domain-containing protein n=1 Tax=Blomia tropicalis TaxID=40697 RepID=A0A9Q0M358_BLOTA|nr:RNA-binding protein 34 [Blomia tropicalis]KAJ6218062.1 hypothetical protein RDWZM_009219 [Blomia tropicalis]
MVEEFKVGSISDIVNSSSGGKIKSIKKKKIPETIGNSSPSKSISKNGNKRKRTSSNGEFSVETIDETAFSVKTQTSKPSIKEEATTKLSSGKKNQKNQRKQKKQSTSTESVEDAEELIKDLEKENQDSIKPKKPLKTKRQKNISKKQNQIKSKNVNDIEEEMEIDQEENDDGDDEKTVEKIRETDEQKKDKLNRTIFIGNVPAGFSAKNLKKNLSEYGKVSSIRIRAVAPAKQTLSKKVAYLSKQVNQHKKVVNVYAVFREIESVDKALALNGTQFSGNTIQVDKATAGRTAHDNKLSLFLGNLPYTCSENDLREFFSDCGELTGVRLIRDAQTGMGKGFGYVTFKSNDGLVLGIQKDGQKINEREIRVKMYHYKENAKAKGKVKERHRKRFQKKTESPSSPKKEIKNESVASNEEQKNSKPKMNNKKLDFKGETAIKNKKLAKKNLKGRIRLNKEKKQKKKISEILSK